MRGVREAIEATEGREQRERGMTYVFLYTPHNRFQSPPNVKLCRAAVADGGRSVGFHQCSRKATVWDGQIGYCAIHNPIAVEAKRKAEAEKYNRESAVNRKKYEIEKREREVLAEAKARVKDLDKHLYVAVVALIAKEQELEQLVKESSKQTSGAST